MGKKHKNYERYFTGTNELSPPNTLFIDKPSICLGKDIPEDMLLDIEDAGLYLGLEKKWGKGYYVGKKSEDDGNVLVY